ncbi:hypothetical protein ACQY0O_004084 [Thecaphora frezii]
MLQPPQLAAEKQQGALPPLSDLEARPAAPAVSASSHRSRPCSLRKLVAFALGVASSFAWYTTLPPRRVVHHPIRIPPPSTPPPYGTFPDPQDPFHLLPCTNDTLPPALDDEHAPESWARLYDPNPDHWSWGKPSNDTNLSGHQQDKYRGRGIYLCGYLDVPLDYTNASDARILRLAVTKYQVSGLAHRLAKGSKDGQGRKPGSKSPRTLVINPGGPGGSGTNYVWRAGETYSGNFTDGTFDVLGWDPRGVNASLPAASCFPYDADRDRWSQLKNRFYETSASDPRAQLQVLDAINEATMRACHERLGDLGRFVNTGMVARDVDEIRKALDEPELTAYMVSYGTGIGQTYANMFPERVGRMLLDGTEYVRDHRLLGGFGWTALDNITDAYRDGLLGECVEAGPKHCDLARPGEGEERVTLEKLEERMDRLFKSVLERPVPGYLEKSGATVLTYSTLIDMLYTTLYNAFTWPGFATMLYELEQGNASMALEMAEASSWQYDPTAAGRRTRSDELTSLVICSDSYDAPQPEGLEWWEHLWKNMTRKSFIGGNGRFLDVVVCRHFGRWWPDVKGVYRGGLGRRLRNKVLLVAETYDPATPLRNGRRLLGEMGEGARLVVHHGYGHASRDTSACTRGLMRQYLLEGAVPEQRETQCYADEKPYRYGGEGRGRGLEVWRAHVEEMRGATRRGA